MMPKEIIRPKIECEHDWVRLSSIEVKDQETKWCRNCGILRHNVNGKIIDEIPKYLMD